MSSDSMKSPFSHGTLFHQNRGHPLGLVTASGLRTGRSVPLLPPLLLARGERRSVRTNRSRAHGVRSHTVARAFWWTTWSGYFSGPRERRLDQLTPTLTGPSLTTLVKLRSSSMTFQTCSHPHGSCQDEAQLLYFSSSALQTTIHQHDVMIHSSRPVLTNTRHGSSTAHVRWTRRSIRLASSLSLCRS